MKVSKTKFYGTILMIILLSQIYISSFKFNIFFQLFIFLFFIFFERPKISIRFLGIILPIILMLSIGFLGTFIFRRPLGFVIKDSFYFIKPVLGVLLGYFLYKKIDNSLFFFQTLIRIAVISAIIHFIIVLFFTDFTSSSISEIRRFTKGNYLELFSLIILWYYHKFSGHHLFSSQQKIKFFKVVLLLSCVLYFSRTMIVATIILLLSIYSYTKLTLRSIKAISITLLSILVLYFYLFSTKLDRNKGGLETVLYKIKIAPAELFKTKIDRENHKDLWDHWRGYEAKRAFALLNENPLYYVIGTGYGSLVNLKFKAPLTEDEKGMKYISRLHNGYVYILYKLGLFGLLIYLFFLYRLYRFIYSNYSIDSVFISAIGLYYLFSTITITGIYNAGDPVIFILGVLLCKRQNENINDNLI